MPIPEHMQEHMAMANLMIEAITEDEQLLPNIAKMLRKLYDALVEEGFTHDQATRIVANYKATGN